MAYDTLLAKRVRTHLVRIPHLLITEKKMFGGLAFLVNGKMCINISGNQLMCRFDPDEETVVTQKRGYLPVIMRGHSLKGYCRVLPEAIVSEAELLDWIDLCLRFNPKASGT